MTFFSIPDHLKGPDKDYIFFLLAINPRRICAAAVTVVGSVCVSVKSHFTSGASVCPENTVTYAVSNKDKNMCGELPETTAF